MKARAAGRTTLRFGCCPTKSAHIVKAQASGDLENGFGTMHLLGSLNGTWIGTGKGVRNDTTDTFCLVCRTASWSRVGTNDR